MVWQASTLSEAVSVAWRQGGVLALYRGFGATLCLDLPFALLQFPLYEQIKLMLSQRRAASSASSASAASSATSSHGCAHTLIGLGLGLARGRGSGSEAYP